MLTNVEGYIRIRLERLRKEFVFWAKPTSSVGLVFQSFQWRVKGTRIHSFTFNGTQSWHFWSRFKETGYIKRACSAKSLLSRNAIPWGRIIRLKGCQHNLKCSCYDSKSLSFHKWSGYSPHWNCEAEKQWLYLFIRSLECPPILGFAALWKWR